MKNVNEVVKGLLKKANTKQKVVDFVNNFDTKSLTKEGVTYINFLKDSAFVDMKEWKLSEMKDEVMLLLDDAKNFKANVDVVACFENALKIKKKDDVEQGAEELEKIMTKKQDKKEDKAPNKLTEKQIVDLCGYRYTYPTFPQEFEVPTYKDVKFEAIHSEDLKEVEALIDASFEEGDDIVCVMYFPKYERDYDIDPHGVANPNTSKKQLLKSYGGHYPMDLDIQQIVHFHADTQTMVSISAYTGLPYATSCTKKWFEVNDTLKCRVTQNGLDYQLYRKITK